MSIKSTIEKALPNWALNAYRRIKFSFGFKSGVRTYSQEGEDLILGRILNKKKGFYVDIGAHHPFRYSNTYILFTKGWSGLNIDASPETIALFNKNRPKDINLNLGVSNSDGELLFYQFEDGAYNTFSQNLARDLISKKLVKLRSKTPIPVQKLSTILKNNLRPGQVIDVMSVDVEGLDFNVLKSNDWTCFKPKVILVELQSKNIPEVIDSEVNKYLSGFGYVLYSKLVHTAIFVQPNFDDSNG